MTWQLALLTTTALIVAATAVRSWLRSDEHREAVARRDLRRRAGEADPLVTLAIQMRLGELAAELRKVDEDPDVFARAHHWRAVQGAYDALLREACRLSALPVEDVPLRLGEHAAAEERLREELELSSRGWSW
ncbi:hypothetical protein [Isoptericola variabilis]|uniref:Uncharacterized protein n=1 Tax=Isoptericola variabilis (strain 225) TaxID=743718 RepID=F6FT00_ISOV2|nr:hypothetical protein [Isoptericola variabilis]AEG43141.1 hypothetical protein Isova_0342 [Isoptericola variabilis 225]TWH35072.1 hypothetical protein L600_000100000760 [Isoptericola variabilis J7]